MKSHLANFSCGVSVAIMILLVAAATTTTTTAYSTTTAPLSAGGGEQQAVSSNTTNTNNNNVSNALLGSLFLVVEFERTSVNPVNETYMRQQV